MKDPTIPAPTPISQLSAPIVLVPRVPDHELLRQVGRGAYGEVWLARSITGAFRAVKIVRRNSFDHDRPFEREFEGIRKFEPLSRRHDSQVDVLHVGRGEDYFYYVMELADDQASGGQIDPDNYQPRTLKSDLLFHSRLSFENCLSVGIALATALEHLHQNGLVHRDVKPSNIIFVNGVPKLADIGLVTGVDATQSYVGTEGFAAPEGPGTPQADLFSLGKVLYEIATGKDRQEFPELPTNLRELPDREGMVELNAVIVKACRHDPQDRYASAASMRADLELLQSGKSLARLRGMEQRLRVLQRGGAAVTLLALLIAAGWVWQARQTAAIKDLASEKTHLAESLSAVEASQRHRLARLHISKGTELLNEKDPAGALLWFAEALQLLDDPSETEIHRIRIQQTLDHVPHLLRMFPHESLVGTAVFSPDGQRIATGTYDGLLRLWNARTGALEWGPKKMHTSVCQLRFVSDGERLFASSSPLFPPGPPDGFFALFETASGREILQSRDLVGGASTNIVWTALSQDEQWVAFSHGAAISVYSLREGRVVRNLMGHADEVCFLNFGASSRFLVSSSQDQTARVWDVEAGQLAVPPFKHSSPVVSAMFTHDGKHLITGRLREDSLSNLRSEIRVWSTNTGMPIGKPIQPVRDLYFVHARADQFFASPEDGTFAFSLQGAKLYPLEDSTDEMSWHFNASSDKLVIGGSDSRARLFSTQTGRPLGAPFHHSRYVTSVQLSPNEDLLLTGSEDGNARIWQLADTREESRKAQLPAFLHHLASGSFNRRSEYYANALTVELQDRTVAILDRDLNEKHRLVSPIQDRTLQWALTSTNGNRWAVGCFSPETNAARTFLLWRETNSSVQVTAAEHEAHLLNVGLTADGRYFISESWDNRIHFWRTEDGQWERTVSNRIHGYHCVEAFSPDGSLAALRCWDPLGRTNAELVLLDLETENPVGKPHLLSGVVAEYLFSPDSRLLCLVDPNGPVTVLNVTNGQVLSSSIRHIGNLLWAQWAPDSRRLLTAGTSDKVLVWDALTGTQVLPPLVATGQGRFARWSPDGQFIVTMDDHTVRVWDANTGEAVTPDLPHATKVHFAILTPERRLITASAPDLLRAWDLKPTKLDAAALSNYAQFLSGRRLDNNGIAVQLTAEELSRLSASGAALLALDAP